MLSVVSMPCTVLIHWYVAESLNTAMLLDSTDLVTKPLSSVKYSTENPSIFTVIEELLLMMVSSLLHVIKAVGQLGWQVMLKLLPSMMSLTLASSFTTTVRLGTPEDREIILTSHVYYNALNTVAIQCG